MKDYARIHDDFAPISLRNVYAGPKDEQNANELLLFRLLSERDKFVNISHKDLPSYSNHVQFVRSKPYLHWYVIEKTDRPNALVGAIYVSKQYEVGLFVLRAYQRQQYGSWALRTLLNVYDKFPLYANINPANRKSIKFFKKHGFRYSHEAIGDGIVKQITYVLAASPSRKAP